MGRKRSIISLLHMYVQRVRYVFMPGRALLWCFLDATQEWFCQKIFFFDLSDVRCRGICTVHWIMQSCTYIQFLLYPPRFEIDGSMPLNGNDHCQAVVEDRPPFGLMLDSAVDMSRVIRGPDVPRLYEHVQCMYVQYLCCTAQYLLGLISIGCQGLKHNTYVCTRTLQ